VICLVYVHSLSAYAYQEDQEGHFVSWGLTAIAAGLAMPTQSHAATASDADAELIALCAKFVALETERHLLCRHDAYAPDFGPNHEVYARLSDEQGHTINTLEECEPPTSPSGYAAVARAALVWADIGW
jgi:hypothetical protein